jgi:hypothetical protein
LLYSRVFLQKAGYREGIFTMARHAQRQRFDPAQDKETIHWSGYRAHRILQEFKARPGLVVVKDNRTADDVGMAAKVLRGAVHDKVGPKSQRFL